MRLLLAAAVVHLVCACGPSAAEQERRDYSAHLDRVNALAKEKVIEDCNRPDASEGKVCGLISDKLATPEALAQFKARECAGIDLEPCADKLRDSLRAQFRARYPRAVPGIVGDRCERRCKTIRDEEREWLKNHNERVQEEWSREAAK